MKRLYFKWKFRLSLSFGIIDVLLFAEITTETATEEISNIIDTIDQLIINNKVQLIDLTENDVRDKGREDEEVECEVKPDASSTFIRYAKF